MILRETLTKTILFLLAIAMFACSRTFIGLTKERISVDKKLFKIQVPRGAKRIEETIGGHGLWFTVIYPDSSFIYYSSDWAFITPNNSNYKTIGFNPPPGGITSDSTIGGEQTDGRYWKEIFYWTERYKRGYWIGYKNVSKDRVSLFDKSLLTLTQ